MRLSHHVQLTLLQYMCMHVAMRPLSPLEMH